MSKIENMWQVSPAHVEEHWASIWILPDPVGQPPYWPFTVNEVLTRLNEWLGCLGSDFKFEPDPRLSNDHYALMFMRDHTQALAVSLLGRMAAQTLLDEKSGR